jgi:hypothetical protein
MMRKCPKSLVNYDVYSFREHSSSAYRAITICLNLILRGFSASAPLQAEFIFALSGGSLRKYDSRG